MIDTRDSSPFVPRSVVIDGSFDWEGDVAPDRPLHETVIYEMHVKGFTKRHPGVPDQVRGTYAGLAHPAAIEHLVTLGVTAVERMARILEVLENGAQVLAMMRVSRREGMTGPQAIPVHEPATPEDALGRSSDARRDAHAPTSVDAARDVIDEAAEESFPASDPPTWTPILGARIGVGWQ